MAYMGSYTKETDKVHFLYKGTQGTQDDTADIGNAACKRYEFIAQYSGCLLYTSKVRTGETGYDALQGADD